MAKILDVFLLSIIAVSKTFLDFIEVKRFADRLNWIKLTKLSSIASKKREIVLALGHVTRASQSWWLSPVPFKCFYIKAVRRHSRHLGLKEKVS